MNTDVDTLLDQIALKQAVFKNTKLLGCVLLICEKAASRRLFWPDEIMFDFLLTDDDRNCIGSAWRLLSKTLPIIEKTGNFRRSKSKDANGRTIFEYRLVNEPLARCILKRYDKAKYLKLCEPQMNFF